MKWIVLGLSFGFATVAQAGVLQERFTALGIKSPVAVDFQATKANDGELELSELGIEHSSCYGTCPAYTLIIKADGSVYYEGGRHADKQGVHRGRIAVWHLHQLARYIQKIKFFELEDIYTERVTDHATVYTSVTVQGKEKIISNYADSGPIELWALEQLIDGLLVHVEW